MKTEPTNEINFDFVFENEFIKREKIPKLEVLDMDIVESKPMLDISQQSKDTIVAQDTNKNQTEFHENKFRFNPNLSVTMIKRNECSMCGKYFDNIEKLKPHNQNHDLSNYMCQPCEKYFINELRLKRLKSKVNGTFLKDENKNGNQKFNLNKVVSSNEIEVKTIKKLDHECEVCKKGFIDKNNLKRHKKIVHDFDIEKSINIVSPFKNDRLENQKDLRCKTCDETFKSKSSFKNHNKTYHSNSVTFKCGTCDKTFDNAQKLTDHSNWHKFKCEKCQKYFQSKHRLELHRKTHTTAAAVWKVWLD